MLSIAIIYDTDKRYVFPFKIAQDCLNLTEDDLKKLEAKLKREIQKL